MELTAQNLEVLQSSHATSSQVDAFIANLQPNSPPASPSLSSEHAASHTSATLASRRSHPTSIPTTSVPRRSARALHQTSTRTSDQRHQLLHNATNKRSKQALSSIDSEHHARLDQRKAKRARQKAIRDGHAQETVRPSKKKRKDMHEKQKQRGTSQKPQSTKAKGKPIGKAKKHSATSEDDQASVQHLKDRKSELERTAFKRQRRKMVNVNQNRITLRPVATYGVFSRGASSKIVKQSRGVPDLTFKNYAFMAKPNAESSRPVFLPTANAETSSKVRQQYERSNCSGTEEEPSRPKTGLTSTQRKQLRPTPSKLPADLPACSESKRMGQYEHHFPNEITDSDLSAAHSAYSLNLRRQHKEAVHTRTNLELERVAKGALGSSKPRLRPPPSPIVSQIPFSQPPPPMHHQKSRPLKRNQRDFPKGSSHEELYRMNSTNAYAKSVTRGEELSPVSNVTTCHPPQQPQPDPFPSVHEKDCPRVGSPVPYRTSYAIPALDVEPDTVCMEGWNGLPTPEKLAHYLSDTSEILPQCGKWGRQEDDNSNMNHVIDREGSECPQVHLSMLDGTPPYGKSPEPHFGPGSKHMSYKEVPTPQWYDDQEEWDRGASHSDDVELYDLALPTEQAPPSRLRSFLAAHLMVEHSRGDRPLLEEDDTSNFWHCER